MLCVRRQSAAVIRPRHGTTHDPDYDPAIKLRSQNGSESIAHRLQLIQITRPVAHEPASALKQIRTPVGGLD